MKTYRIEINKSWRFRFEGELPWWRRTLIRLAGWNITQLP